MLLIIFLTPVITSFILLICFRKKISLFEYLGIFVGSWMILGISYAIMKSVNSSDTEYLGYYVTKVSHYDKWNERQRRTRTVTTGTGKHRHTRTETYYVTVTHPECWELTLNNDNTHSISKDEYKRIVKKFGTEEIFRDMHRHYHTIDGDAQDYFYPDKDRSKLEPFVEIHSYTNKIKGSKSIFNLVEITDEDKEAFKLFDYPPVKDNYQKTILGLKFSDKTVHKFDVINSIYGKKEQFRLYMLFFKDMSPMVAEYQKSYWEGGNKNELVLCFGYSGNKITWCEGFSWCDNPIIEASAKMYFINNPELSKFDKFADYLEPMITQYWERKNFEDFDYLAVDLSMTQLWVTLILVLLVNIGIAVFSVMNDYDLELKEKN